MAKKKKKKTQRNKDKQVQPQFKKLNLDQLLSQGKQFLANKNPREALNCFKMALKKGASAEQVNIYIFRAYLLRESQLREKGMVREAEAIKKQANGYFPKVDQLSGNDITLYVSTSSNKEALNAYNKYIAVHKISPETEIIFANRIFTGQNPDFINNLDEASPLKRDADTAYKGILLMNDGLWEDALNVLHPIPRSSPFAHIRLFCRAMVSFYNENDADMFKALSLIPDDFPLISIVKGLSSIYSTGMEYNSKKESFPLPQCLWETPVNHERIIADFIQKSDLNNPDRTAKLIRTISDTLYPESPQVVRMLLIQFIWKKNKEAGFQYDSFDDDRFNALAEKNLTPEENNRLNCKINLLYSETPWVSASEYIKILKDEFTDEQDRKIAHSMVLILTVNRIYNENIHIPSNKYPMEQYADFLGIEPANLRNNEMILIDMASKAVQLDPYNIKGYEILVQLQRTSRSAKAKVEESLNLVIKALPDDPAPCLELATILYEKNAFRKAETILKEAIKRAPYDNKVLERHALSFLISAGINFNRGKFHLVIDDIKKAAAVNCSKIAPFLAEKKIFFQIMDEPKKSDSIISSEIKGLVLYEKLRILSILLLDLTASNKVFPNKALNKITKIFNKELKQISNLSSSDIVSLMAPLERAYLALLPSVKMSDIFIKRWKSLSKHIKDTDLIIIFDYIFEENTFGLIEKEIHKRTSRAVEPQRAIMDFYLAVIKYINNENIGSSMFNALINNADAGTLKELQTISRKLAAHTSGPLQSALAVFNFDMLDGFCFNNIFDDDDYDDDDDDDFDNIFNMLNPDFGFDFDENDMLPAADMALKSAELLVQSLGIKGAPNGIIKELRNAMRSDFKIRKEFDAICNILKLIKDEEISREVKILFLGKAAKK